MFFKAIFGHWLDTAKPAFDWMSKEAVEHATPDFEFLVEAQDRKKAEEIAKQYEGIETYAYEGLGNLKQLIEINYPESLHLSPIAIYADYLPEAIKRTKA